MVMAVLPYPDNLDLIFKATPLLTCLDLDLTVEDRDHPPVLSLGSSVAG